MAGNMFVDTSYFVWQNTDDFIWRKTIFLVVAAADQLQTVDNVVLTQKHVLVTASADQLQTVDAVALTQAHIIVVASADQLHTVDSTILTQKHIIVVAAADQLQTVTGDLDVDHNRFYPLEVVQTTLIQNIKNIIQDTAYSSDDILALMNEAQGTISGGIFLVYPDSTQCMSSPLMNLETNDTVETSTSSSYVSLPSDYDRDVFYVFNDTTNIKVDIVSAFSTILSTAPTLANTNSVYMVFVSNGRIYYQGMPSTSQDLILYYFRKPNDMATYASTGISFSGTTISDSENGLGVFHAKQVIDLTGSNRNRGTYTITSVASTGASMVVESSLDTESAGSSITIKSRPDGLPEHLREELLVNYVVTKIFQRKAVRQQMYAGKTEEYWQRFYQAMLDMEVTMDRVPAPIRFVSEG